VLLWAVERWMGGLAVHEKVVRQEIGARADGRGRVLDIGCGQRSSRSTRNVGIWVQ